MLNPIEKFKFAILHLQWRIYKGAQPARAPPFWKAKESGAPLRDTPRPQPPPPTNGENLKFSAPPYGFSWIRH